MTVSLLSTERRWNSDSLAQKRSSEPENSIKKTRGNKIFRWWKSSDSVKESDETCLRVYIGVAMSAGRLRESPNKAGSVLCVSSHSGVSDQSQREEDFYYTRIPCETVDASTAPAPSQQALGQACQLSWTSCASPPAASGGLQIPPAHRPRSNSSSGPGLSRPSPLSQSAPSSFWQIHSEHLYQVGSPLVWGGGTATFMYFSTRRTLSMGGLPSWFGRNVGVLINSVQEAACLS